MRMNTGCDDGFCHNIEPETDGYECGALATWIGVKEDGWRCGFCDECREHGWEARRFDRWETVE